MYSIDVVLVYPSSYIADRDRMIIAIEDALARYVNRESFTDHTYAHSGDMSLTTIRDLEIGDAPDMVKRRLVEKLAGCGFDVSAYLDFRTVNWWEDHARAITFVFGAFGVAGAVIGMLSWLVHKPPPF